MKREWVLPLREQCRRSGVPFFFKQWGGVRKAKTGRRLEGKTYDQFPKRVQHPVMSTEDCKAATRDIEGMIFPSDIIPLSFLARRIPEQVSY